MKLLVCHSKLFSSNENIFHNLIISLFNWLFLLLQPRLFFPSFLLHSLPTKKLSYGYSPPLIISVSELEWLIFCHLISLPLDTLLTSHLPLSIISFFSIYLVPHRDTAFLYGALMLRAATTTKRTRSCEERSSWGWSCGLKKQPAFLRSASTSQTAPRLVHESMTNFLFIALANISLPFLKSRETSHRHSETTSLARCVHEMLEHKHDGRITGLASLYHCVSRCDL